MSNSIEADYFSNRWFRFVLFVVLIIFSGVLRFYNLGLWSHGFDENYTTMETRYFFDGQSIPVYMFSSSHGEGETQFTRLPKMIIAAYFVHWLNYKIFGDDEFGSRVFPAVMGSFGVGIIFLLSYSLFGGSASLILALLILLCPMHILQSQNNRFYSQAFLCISVVLLLGGHLVVKRSVVVAIVMGVMAILMVLTHSLAGLIWGFLIIGILFEFFVTKKSNQKDASKNFMGKNFAWRNFSFGCVDFILVFWSIILLLIAVFHVMPLARSWNNFQTSGVSSINAVVGFMFNFGWSLSMFFVPAFLFVLFNFRRVGYLYWLICVLFCGVSIVFLPFVITYISHYSFLFCFPFFVILALFIDWIFRLIIQSKIYYGRVFAVIWLIFILFFNIPAIASYYQDGGRFDWRSAYGYIREHWQEGDCIICFPLDANRYIPELEPKVQRYERGVDLLERLVDQNKDYAGRVWIPIVFDRHTPDEVVRHLLYNRADYQKRFGKKRYDFEFNNIEIFLYSPNSSKKNK
ncbi:MAG: glycosyltransferase family 39 protein [Planctomycetaceae bacterium]|jgi:hypothetical protein|nr:glycosyltransferase family 39 protein [Planctomycetaceae bacterium]